MPEGTFGLLRMTDTRFDSSASLAESDEAIDSPRNPQVEFKGRTRGVAGCSNLSLSSESAQNCRDAVRTGSASEIWIFGFGSLVWKPGEHVFGGSERVFAIRPAYAFSAGLFTAARVWYSSILEWVVPLSGSRLFARRHPAREEMWYRFISRSVSSQGKQSRGFAQSV